MRPSRAALLLAGTTLAPVAALAQEPAPPAPAARPGATTYLPADFARFAPKTALDMVRQLPGFTIEEGDERRGLGQAADNILINGKRISGKANDALTALGRISADSVIRIEIVDGATLDIPGLSGQVANIVTQIDGIGGSFAYRPQIRLRRTEARLLNGEVSLTGQLGGVDYTLNLSNQSFRNGNAGIETVRDGSGAITDLRREVLYFYGEQPRIAGGFKHESAAGSIANLNLSYGQYHTDVIEDSPRIDRRRDYLETEREWNYEIGGDYEFGLGAGRLKLIGLRRFEHSPYNTRVFFDFTDGSRRAGDRFIRVADEGESIARGEYYWKADGADWQVSAEGALNTLDNFSELAILDAGGSFVPVPFPNASAKVEEERAEATLSHGRPLSPTLTLQALAGAEYSTISQSGETGRTRTFYRPKGFVSLAWKASPWLDVSAKIEREVGQLDFGSFLASVNIAGGQVNSGNPELRPPQSWKAELEATRNLGVWGTVTGRVFGAIITDIVDQVPIGDDGEAPGNLDRATQYGIELKSTVNFDPLGWRGAKLDFRGFFQTNAVDDPLTGISRRISDSLVREIAADLRWDIPATPWAVGGGYSEFAQALGYRLDQVGGAVNSPGNLGLFVENKDVFGLTVRGSVDNLLGTNERYFRTVYAGRRTDEIAFSEDRSRYFGPVLTVAISGSF